MHRLAGESQRDVGCLSAPGRPRESEEGGGPGGDEDRYEDWTIGGTEQRSVSVTKAQAHPVWKRLKVSGRQVLLCNLGRISIDADSSFY